MTEPTLIVLDETSRSRSADDDDLDHIFCACDEDHALCGTDVTDAPIIEDGPVEDECVVCADLDRLPCERCGQ